MATLTYLRFGGESDPPFTGPFPTGLPIDRIDTPACLLNQLQYAGHFSLYFRSQVGWKFTGHGEIISGQSENWRGPRDTVFLRVVFPGQREADILRAMNDLRQSFVANPPVPPTRI